MALLKRRNGSRWEMRTVRYSLNIQRTVKFIGYWILNIHQGGGTGETGSARQLSTTPLKFFFFLSKFQQISTLPKTHQGRGAWEKGLSLGKQDPPDNFSHPLENIFLFFQNFQQISTLPKIHHGRRVALWGDRVRQTTFPIPLFIWGYRVCQTTLSLTPSSGGAWESRVPTQLYFPCPF